MKGVDVDHEAKGDSHSLRIKRLVPLSILAHSALILLDNMVCLGQKVKFDCTIKALLKQVQLGEVRPEGVDGTEFSLLLLTSQLAFFFR